MVTLTWPRGGYRDDPMPGPGVSVPTLWLADRHREQWMAKAMRETIGEHALFLGGKMRLREKTWVAEGQSAGWVDLAVELLPGHPFTGQLLTCLPQAALPTQILPWPTCTPGPQHLRIYRVCVAIQLGLASEPCSAKTDSLRGCALVIPRWLDSQCRAIKVI